jgi:predicted NUDIX family NTP pyrophosphohydrolase
MGKLSAGILLYRRHNEELEVFLVHPGGPYWWKKDLGAWSIPKGEHEKDDDAMSAARREFREETGFAPAEGEFRPLGEVRLVSRKAISAWAIEGDCDASAVHSNLFEMEWPPKSGKLQEFPEVDRAGWFTLSAAREKIHASQGPFLERLLELIQPSSKS